MNETVFTLPGLSDLSCNIILSRIKDIKGCGCKKKDPGLPPESFFKSQMRSPSLPFFPEPLLQIQPPLQHIAGSSHKKRKAHCLHGQKTGAEHMEEGHPFSIPSKNRTNKDAFPISTMEIKLNTVLTATNHRTDHIIL